MNSSGDEYFTNIKNLTDTLDRTSNILSTTDNMIDHYRVLNKEQEDEIRKLHEELVRSKREVRWRNDGDIYNHYRNSTKKSFHDTSAESPTDPYLKRSRQKKRRKSNSINKSKLTNKNLFHHSEDSYLDDSTRGIEYLNSKESENQKTPEGMPLDQLQRSQRSILKDTKQDVSLSHRVKHIQNQVANDYEGLKKQQNEMNNLSFEMKLIKDAIKGVSTSSTPKYSPMSSSRVNYENKINAYKAEILRQKETIRSLTECLSKVDKISSCAELAEEIKLSEWIKSNQLKSLEEELKEERAERMKIMKKYTDAEQRVSESEKERSELLFAVSDMKTEVNEYRHLYERTSQSILELKMLLEESAKQKSQFSEQVTNLQSENVEQKEVIVKMEDKINEYLRKLNSIESENKRLINEIDNCRSVYLNNKKKFESAKSMLLDARNSYEEVERSKQHLQEKAISTLKSYRVKCRKYEMKIEELVEKEKAKEHELSKSVSRTKQLEILNLKQKREFQDLSYRIEGLQGDISEYVKKCNQVSEERNQLEVILSQSNNQGVENILLHTEMQKIKDDNSALKSKLNAECERRREFESLSREHYDRILMLESNNKSLMREFLVEKERLEEEIATVKEESKVETMKEIKFHSETNEVLSQQVQTCKDNEEEIRKKCEQLKSELEKREEHCRKVQVEISGLTENLQALHNENKALRDRCFIERQKFKEHFKAFKSSLSLGKEKNALLQKHVDDIEIVENVKKENFKFIIDTLTIDADNLLNFLSSGIENVRPVKEIPDHILTDYKDQVTSLRKNLHSSFSIAEVLKERFNKQKSLINRAREKIKSQILEIQELTSDSKGEIQKYQEKISTLERIQQDHLKLISKNKNENSSLKNEVKELTKDFQECTKALHKSIELDKNRNAILDEMEHLKTEHRMWMDIDETFFRSTERVDVLTEQLHEAKDSLKEIKKDGADINDSTTRLIETIESISPSRKRRFSPYDSSLLESSKKSTFQNASPSRTFITDIENGPSHSILAS